MKFDNDAVAYVGITRMGYELYWIDDRVLTHLNGGEALFPQSIVNNLRDLSVTNILMRMVPGEDGSGYEVYATSVKEVEDEIFRLSEENKDLRYEVNKVKKDLQKILQDKADK